jgi:hypothetical protein
MWALLDRDNETVIGCIPPTVTFDKALSIANGRTMIPMTVENSPAYMNGKYINGKFHEKKEG